MKTNWCHYFIRILLDLYMFRIHRPIFRRVRTAVHTTIGSVSVPLCSRAVYVLQSTRTERHRYWTNGCVNSCTNTPEDGPVDPKHVEIQQYTNKIVTSVGFHSICWKDTRYKKLKKNYVEVEFLDEIYRNISRSRRVPPSAARGLSRRWTWRHLAEKMGTSKGGGKQWQPTPKNLPRMQCARAIPLAWLGSGSC